jgi:hypothetical protein
MELFSFPEGMETRWTSPENPRGERGAGGQHNVGRKGRACQTVAVGEVVVLAEEAAGVCGTIRRLWLTIDDRSPEMLRGLRFECFWDGAETPAVSAPLGDFFGIGLGRTAVFESVFFSSPEGRSFNCCLPMPFRNGMRITLTNDSGKDLAFLFYDVNYTVGDSHPDDVLYLHALYRRENPTTLQRDYEILPTVTGRGRFLGANIGVRTDKARYGGTWWGEGEVKIYLDGDTEFPTLCGTGTEDYIGTAWGQGQYAHRYQGCPIADGTTGEYCFYRYHVPDPIYFRENIRVTIQQIGHCFGEGKKWLYEHSAATGETIYAAGKGLIPADLSENGPSGVLFERQEDWSSCAYWYGEKRE